MEAGARPSKPAMRQSRRQANVVESFVASRQGVQEAKASGVSENIDHIKPGSSGDLPPPAPPAEQTNRNRLIGISKKAPLNAGLELRGRGLAYPAPLRSI